MPWTDALRCSTVTLKQMHKVQGQSGFALPVLVAGLAVRQLKNARRALYLLYGLMMRFV